MRNLIFFFVIPLFFSCSVEPIEKTPITVIDTNFSKGRLNHIQKISLNDLEKFHGHLCDGLVLGYLAIEYASNTIFSDSLIDRTNLRIVSKPSPCLTDAAIYLTGARYQYNTFYVDTNFSGLYVIQRLDNNKTLTINLKKGVKPSIIDSLSSIAVAQKLDPRQIDNLKQLEDSFSDFLLTKKPEDIFDLQEVSDFKWSPNIKLDFVKTDVINKQLPTCN